MEKNWWWIRITSRSTMSGRVCEHAFSQFQGSTNVGMTWLCIDGWNIVLHKKNRETKGWAWEVSGVMMRALNKYAHPLYTYKGGGVFFFVYVQLQRSNQACLAVLLASILQNLISTFWRNKNTTPKGNMKDWRVPRTPLPILTDPCDRWFTPTQLGWWIHVRWVQELLLEKRKQDLYENNSGRK